MPKFYATLMYLRWFQDNCVSSCQEWSHFPCQHHQWVIPRNDQATRADWFFLRNTQVLIWPGVVDWNRCTLSMKQNSNAHQMFLGHQIIRRNTIIYKGNQSMCIEVGNKVNLLKNLDAFFNVDHKYYVFAPCKISVFADCIHVKLKKLFTKMCIIFNLRARAQETN